MAYINRKFDTSDNPDGKDAPGFFIGLAVCVFSAIVMIAIISVIVWLWKYKI